MKKHWIALIVALAFATVSLRAQGYWQELPETYQSEGHLSLSQFQPILIDLDALSQNLAKAPAEEDRARAHQMLLPGPDGKPLMARIWRTPVMAEGLARQFPDITTYAGQLVDQPAVLLRLDLSPRGFHLMALDPHRGTWFIDPDVPGSDVHLVYRKSSLTAARDFVCELEDEVAQPLQSWQRGPTPNGEELRIYRTAVAATGEYTNYHGGTVDGAMAAITTTMNRVNGVYERDLSCRMVLVDSNQLIIFTNPNTDPYSGGSATKRNINQGVVDDSIGTANYDVGHVFDVGGGGIASISTICIEGNKARGYTALTPPEGDPFDIDYVAHEFGHQFGGLHSFNACPGPGNVPYEPGSGVTIMAYAGICGSNNIALNSIDHFHVKNVEDMIQVTVFETANACPEVQATNNTPPVVDPGTGGWVIPMSTPFELEGSATDAQGDSLTYCWEQFDLGPSSSPNNPSGNAPLFRSFSPTTNPTRTFPRITDVLNGTQTFGEILPSYAREMKFRLSVRDNHGFGGGIDWEEIDMSVTDLSGPFKVTSQSEATTWAAGSLQRIDWDVAATDLPPVNAESVLILFSRDGGFTWTDTLLQTANSGSAVVRVPDSDSTFTARIKVKAVNNVFFQVNEAPITVDHTPSGFSAISALAVNPECQADEVSISVYFSTYGGFNEQLQLSVEGLPQGISAAVDPPAINGSDTVSVTLTNLNSLDTNMVIFGLRLDWAMQDSLLPLEVLLLQPAGPLTMLSPQPDEANVSTLTDFSWPSTTNATTYFFQLSEDPSFSDLVVEVDGVPDTLYDLPGELATETVYYWKLAGQSEACGTGVLTEGSFATEKHLCKTYQAEDLPVPFDDKVFIQSTVSIEEDLGIRDVNVYNIQGTYPDLGELRILLRSPNNFIDFVDNQCNNEADFHFGVDDDSPNGPLPCPYNDGEVYRPEESLGVLDGSSTQGDWILRIFDDDNQGELTNWTLEICYGAMVTDVEDPASAETVGLQVYPNPAQSLVNVQFDLPRGEYAQLILLDALGRQVHLVEVNDTGRQQLPISVSGLPEGLYFLQLRSSQGVLGTSRVVVSRR